MPQNRNSFNLIFIRVKMVHQRRAQIMLFEDLWVNPIPPLMKLHSRINNLNTMWEVFHFPISLIIIFLSSNFSIRYHPQECSFGFTLLLFVLIVQLFIVTYVIFYLTSYIFQIIRNKFRTLITCVSI